MNVDQPHAGAVRARGTGQAQVDAALVFVGADLLDGLAAGDHRDERARIADRGKDRGARCGELVRTMDVHLSPAGFALARASERST